MQFLRDIFSCSKWTYIFKIMYVKKRAFWKLLLLCSKHEPCLMCVNCTFESNSLTCHLNQFLEFQIGETGHTTVLSGTSQLAAKQSHVLQNWMPTSLLLNRNVRNTLLAHLTSPSADRMSNVTGTQAISTRLR